MHARIYGDSRLWSHRPDWRHQTDASGCTAHTTHSLGTICLICRCMDALHKALDSLLSKNSSHSLMLCRDTMCISKTLRVPCLSPPCLDETPCASARPYVCPVCHPFTKSQDTMRISKTAYLGVLPFLHASEPSPNLQFLLRFNPEKAANMQGESICEALTVIRSPNHGVGVLICVVQNSRNTQVSDFDVVVSSQKNIHRLHVAMQNLQDQCSACQEQAHAHTHARTPSHKCTRTTKQC